MITNHKMTKLLQFLFSLALLSSVSLQTHWTCAQTSTTNATKPPVATIPNAPLYREYRGVSIGMGIDEARQKLGKAKSSGPKQDFYVFSDKESAQVYYRESKVFAVSVDYVGSDSGAPGATEILGVEVTPKKNGSLYKMVRYPEAGFWVSYSRTAAESPITTVTMQKIRGARH